MVACGVLTGVAYVARASQRIEKHGFKNSLSANLTDLAFTGATFGSVGFATSKFTPVLKADGVRLGWRMFAQHPNVLMSAAGVIGCRKVAKNRTMC